MTYEEIGNAETVEAILKKAGFIVSERCCVRPSCFDFVARKNSALVFLKIQPDIGNLSSSDSKELSIISDYVSASSLMVGRKAREKPLEEDTVYSRHNVLAVTLKTFENVMLHKIYPLIQAGPGGYYVEIDGEAIKRRRQELGLSIGDAAQLIGISRRTLYGYERGMAKASVTAAYKLIWALGIPVGKTINLLKMHEKQRKHFLIIAREVVIKNKILRRIFRKLARCNITPITVKKAPFDFLINVSEEKVKIVGGVGCSRERQLSKRADEILSVSRVIQAHPVFITDEQKLSESGIQCIKNEELSKIEDFEDLILKLT